jgi:nitronate monooxygenase
MTRRSREFAARLNVSHPIFQAPMAGSTTPALVAAVSNAGGMGWLGAAYFTPEQIAAGVAEIRRLTDKPFGVNLFAGGYEEASGRQAVPAAAQALMARHHAALGLPPPEPPPPFADPLPAQAEALLAARVPAFSFTFGIPDPAILARFRRDGTCVIGTATTVGEARRLAEAGVDAVVAQGSEAGAHRGTFAVPFEMAMLGTMALVPQVAAAVPHLPVIASGGIMDGRGIVAALALGASAVAMGTAFLVTDEAGISDAYRARLLAADPDRTRTTRAFSGRPARGLVNAFMEEAEAAPGAIAPFPMQNALTRPMRNAAGKAGDTERLSLWAGQGVGLARRMKAGDLVRKLIEECAAARADLAG